VVLLRGARELRGNSNGELRDKLLEQLSVVGGILKAAAAKSALAEDVEPRLQRRSSERKLKYTFKRFA
jgi:hypothetical protein